MAPPVDPDSPRFARQRVLSGFGAAAQRRLGDAHVLVIGAGGLGCAILPVLSAAGIGRLTVVDDDLVEESNLHRQTLFGPADAGRPKAEAAAEALAAIAPDIEIRALAQRFATGRSFDLLLDVDVLVDASDNRATRYLANDAATIRGIPLVWGSALGYDGQVGVAWDERGVDYRDLFPERPGAADEDCATIGVLPSVCTVIGGMMASETIKLLTGIGEPLVGRVAAYDALGGRVREIAYRRDPGAPRPGSVEERTAMPEENPMRSVTPEELATALAGPQPPALLDVRQPWEAELVSLPGSTLIPLRELPDRLGELDPTVPLVVYCHVGARSARALELLQQSGFTHVSHLTGGVEAWALTVDPSLPRY